MSLRSQSLLVTKCGDSYRDNETAVIGHNYVQETVSATCTEHGGIKYTCTRCGISYNGSQSEPLGHVYVTETVAATCEEGGYTTVIRTIRASRSVITSL